MGIYQDGMYPMLKDAKISYENVLIRTILDNKIFNGRVFSKEDFLIFQQDYLIKEKEATQQDWAE